MFFLTLLTTFLNQEQLKAYAQSDWEKIESINSSHIQVLEITPTGVLAGEFDTRVYLNPPPFNGLYFSRDSGKTWDSIGLGKRGVLDLKYFNGVIYASTYYAVDGVNGLLYSANMGQNWTKIGPPGSTTKVDRDSKTIYLGMEHNGLYVSNDEGIMWEKKIPEAGTSWKVYEIQSSEDITLVSKNDRVYKSTDNGETWQPINDFDGKSINNLCIYENNIFAGSSGNYGLFLSKDLGETWEWVESFGNYPVGRIFHFENNIYAGRYSPEKDLYTIYYSPDEGDTWIDTNLNSPKNDKAVSISQIFSEPKYLLTSISNQGVYIYSIPNFEIPKEQFLNIPWNYSRSTELLDKITSYFDHSYPLLGYNYFSEPESESDSTTNFYGYKDSIPNIYYSNHGGTDFGLKYGTNIKAPASGYASYYYCKDCGNSIKIDLQNGYETTYMHLQDDGLVTNNEEIYVNNDDIIGKVGLTGRTTGPHLHFEVTRDVDVDESFSNDYPMGRVDPFGWQATNTRDPWEYFSWQDTLGAHSGTKSYYLWNILNNGTSQAISADTGSTGSVFLIHNNKKIIFNNVINNFTAKLTPYIKPALDESKEFTKYIENTSFVIEAFDQIGNEIENFTGVSFDIYIDPANLLNIDVNTLLLKYWDNSIKNWVPIESTFDTNLSKLIVQTDHLSWFAIFGDKIDSTPPYSDIILRGSKHDDWFIEPPRVQIIIPNSEPDLDSITYSTSEGDTWVTYTQPFLIGLNGITNIIYKTIDANGNIETEKDYTVHVNFNNSPTKKIKVVNSNFKIGF